jgi:magnesium transporter
MTAESDPDFPQVETADETLDEDNRLKADFVRLVLDAVERGDGEEAYRLAQPLHAADIADLFELTAREDRADLAIALGDLLSADVLAEINDWVRDDIVDALPAAQIADLAEQMETDDAVAMIEDLEEEEQQAVLAELDPEDRAVDRRRAFLSRRIRRPHHAARAGRGARTYDRRPADRLSARNQDLTTEFWEIFVVDPAHRPIGTCQLSWIMRTPRNISISDVMKREQTLIPVDMDQEEVALRFQKYALISAAVVDDAGRLVGVITADDVVHIVQEEAGEDMLRLSGAGEGDINEPIPTATRRACAG